MAGCLGDLIELKPSSNDDLAAAAGADLATVDQASDEMSGSAPKFFPDIQADLDAKGCGNASCHAPGKLPPTFVLMPTATADQDTNYNSFKTPALTLETAGDPTSSHMLKIMLPGGGHGGSTQLPSVTDPVYLRWLAWVTAGGPR